MQVDYREMHGTGNRILVVDQRRDNLPAPTADRVRRLAELENAPRFDQLMWVSRAMQPMNAASYRVFNSDGSEVEQCGNGVRCVARTINDSREQTETLRLESPTGVVEARALDDGRIAVDMGPPEFDPARIPLHADGRQARYEIDVEGQAIRFAAVSMGNPHCVIEVNDVETADVGGLGPLIERHERFPNRVNVGFMQVVDRRTIRLRVFERGVGETLACGTGACAAVVCGRQLGLLDDEVVVDLPGGQLMVSWRGESEPVWLAGDAELISEGSIDI